MKVKAWAVVTACAALLLLFAAPDLCAQGSRQQLLRPLVKTHFYPAGVTDNYYPAGAGILSLQYPGYYTFGNGGYGGVRYGRFSWNYRAYQWGQREAHGVWYLTGDGKVVYTAPRSDMQNVHIWGALYDVSADPDLSKLGRQNYEHRRTTLKMGFGDQVAAGVSLGGLGQNWWPGSDYVERYRSVSRLDRPPVHILNWNFQEYLPTDNWPEEILVAKWSTTQGLTTTERLLGWSHPDFDDFYIDEYEIENTGDTNGDGKPDLSPVPAQNNFFFGVADRFAPSGAGVNYMRYLWENDRDWVMDDWYKYDPTRKLIYVYDGDHPLYNEWDDTGDPYYDAYAAGAPGGEGGRCGQTEGQILSFAYVGVAPLAYTGTGAYKFNARDQGQGYIPPEGDQPYAVRYWEVFSNVLSNDPNISKMNEAQVYAEVVGAGRKIGPDPDHPSGQFSMMLFGPYSLPPGGKAKVVVAYAAGHPGQMKGNVDPMTWARSSATVAQKQAELPLALQALKQNLDAAKFAYDNAYDIPDAPPDVNFKTGSSGDAHMTVDWPDAIEKTRHPDYAGDEAQDIAGYRVYRSTWFEVGPYELVADIPKGTASRQTPAYKLTYANGLYTVEDLQSAAGFFYHYSVRAYAKGHKAWSAGNANSPLDMARLPAHIAANVQKGQEGGYAAPTQRIYADESPFQPPTVDTEALQRRVLVVPNPYLPNSDTQRYPGSTKLRFVGIPSKCHIRIFSVSGDLVGQMKVDDPTKGESDYDQQTWVYNGELATGVYVFVVENLVDGPNKGKLQRGAFMVVR